MIARFPVGADRPSSLCGPTSPAASHDSKTAIFNYLRQPGRGQGTGRAVRSYILVVERRESLNRKLITLACAVLVLAVAGAPLVAQVPKQEKPKADPIGTWTGFTLIGDGSRAELTMVVEKGESGYTGKITGDPGMVPEMALKNAALKDATFTFDVELPQDVGTMIIHIELKLEGDTFKGQWTDANGESNIIELEKKK